MVAYVKFDVLWCACCAVSEPYTLALAIEAMRNLGNRDHVQHARGVTVYCPPNGREVNACKLAEEHAARAHVSHDHQQLKRETFERRLAWTAAEIATRAAVNPV